MSRLSSVAVEGGPKMIAIVLRGLVQTRGGQQTPSVTSCITMSNLGDAMPHQLLGMLIDPQADSSTCSGAGC